MLDIQAEGGWSKAQRVRGHPIGERGERGSVCLFFKVLLQELLAIGLVGLATALIVTLITWIVYLIE